MIKDFNAWHQVKTEIQHRNPPSFKERDIWWCHLGLNLGTESDGKHQDYLRPVIILKKFNRKSFIGTPLTSQLKERPHYFRFSFRGRMQMAMLPQIRKMDSMRLLNKMGELRQEPFDALKEAAKRML